MSDKIVEAILPILFEYADEALTGTNVKIDADAADSIIKAIRPMIEAEERERLARVADPKATVRWADCMGVNIWGLADWIRHQGSET